MKIFKFSVFIYALLFVGVNNIFAQISEEGTPRSFSENIENNIDVVQLKAPSLSEIDRQDDFSEKNGQEQRIGLSITAELSPQNSGSWTELKDGTKIWRLKIISEGAKAISLYYDRFVIPKGGKLFIYSEDTKQLLGAYTSVNNPNKKEFATELIYGDKVILEYNKPSNVTDKLDLFIGEIGYIYRGITNFNKSVNWTEPSEACEVNVNCTPVGDDWQDEKRGVTRILLKEGGDQFWCTGSLINNTSYDCTPYFLTAYHCGGSASEGDHNQWVFYFNYEAQACTTPINQPSSNTLTGCELKAISDINGGSDLQLLELNTAPPVGYNLYYNGWDRSTSGSTSGVGIHHPAGSIKKISTYTSTLSSSTYQGQVTSASLAHWRVKWSSNDNGWGVTEGGSSGSPLFNANGLIVGTLTGGSSYCDAQYSPDFYGKFSKHWSLGSLASFLDPANTGVTSLQGTNVPCEATEVTKINNIDRVQIYPNPTSKTINISGVDNFLQLQIFDINGKLVKNINNYVNQIDVSELSNGNYILKLILVDTVISKKLIIIE